MVTVNEKGEEISEYNEFKYIHNGNVYINEESVVITRVYKIGFNYVDMSIDCFDENNKIIGIIYYKKLNCDVYCEDYETDKTITLAENGEIINKEW